MLTLKEINKDLKEIRYYYSRQKLFDSMSNTIVQNSVLDKVHKYNLAIKNAPAKLYALYVSLYVHNNTQETLAYDWDFSPNYITVLNKKLCEFFQNALD